MRVSGRLLLLVPSVSARHHRVGFRVSDAERDRIHRTAEKIGMSRSEFMRRTVMAATRRALDPPPTITIVSGRRDAKEET